MKYTKAEAFLKKVEIAKTALDCCSWEVENLRATAEGLAGGGQTIMMDGELHAVEKVSGSSETFDKIGEAVAKLVEKEEHETELLIKYAEAINEVTGEIRKLEPLQFKLLHEIYVQMLTPLQISEAHDKSVSWVSTNKTRALAALDKILQ